MKVKIGKYKNWFGPYQLADMICFWVKDVKDEYGVPRKPEWVDTFGDFLAHGFHRKEKRGDVWSLTLSERPTTWLYDLLVWIDSKRERKVEIRIDPWDTWNMDTTLSPIILPMLKQLRKTKHGSPGTMLAFNNTSNSKQMCFDFYKDGDDLAWDVGHSQWEEIMDKMIWSFEQLNTDWEAQFHTGKMDTLFVKREDGLFSMEKGAKDTHKFDFEGHAKHDARIQEGLELFGKYYRNLWD